jgi:hypothetical protein
MNEVFDWTRAPAAEDRFAYDELGIRHLITAGDPLPSGWVWEGQPEEPEPEPKKPAATRKPRSPS